jgi:peptidoglycan/LPS O-acetylase OafA/YrhL
MALSLTRAEIVPAAIAIAAGVASWELVRRLGGRREAWDDPMYWQLGYPLLLAAAFALGLIWREQPWRWVVIMLGTQAAWSFLLALVDSGVPNLFPLGLVMFALLGLPCLGMAYAGKWLGGRVLG